MRLQANASHLIAPAKASYVWCSLYHAMLHPVMSDCKCITTQPAAFPVVLNQTQPAGTKLSDKFTGTVCEVVSGDCLVVRDAANGQERRVNLSSIRAPRLGRKGEKPEDWATEAKEFLRQRLIGQLQPFWSSLLWMVADLYIRNGFFMQCSLASIH
jgi:hypothetical protein